MRKRFLIMFAFIFIINVIAPAFVKVDCKQAGYYYSYYVG